MNCSACGQRALTYWVTAQSSGPVDDDEVLYIDPQALTSPDTIEVGLSCGTCGTDHLLSDSDWRWA